MPRWLALHVTITFNILITKINLYFSSCYENELSSKDKTFEWQMAVRDMQNQLKPKKTYVFSCFHVLFIIARFYVIRYNGRW